MIELGFLIRFLIQNSGTIFLWGSTPCSNQEFRQARGGRNGGIGINEDWRKAARRKYKVSTEALTFRLANLGYITL